jgi:metal-responsive CopG/Arc/MetJ family transcriptional regulator
MAAVSLKLSDDLARESKQVADAIGISRTELIRRALRRELDDIEARLEREAMARGLRAMRDDPDYRREAESLDQAGASDLPAEPDAWWRG